ncbi:MAG: protease modulator HflK family protein [Candidatus Hydrogenedentes bacterium]|nr:protease modulator HflK family protein [Candidatus Hydrogenedentota bacterium]
MLKDRRIRAATVSVGANLCLVGLKLWGASLSGSAGLQADALHSLSDVGVSLLVLFSVLSAWKSRKWSRVFEEATAFIIGAIIIGVGIVSLLSVNAAFARPELQQLPVAIVLTWFCILVSYFVARYKMRVGRECGAVNLQADGHHSQMDMYSSVAVLIGLLGNWSGLNLDAAASLIVGLLILRIGLVVLAAAAESAFRKDLAVAEAMDHYETIRKWGALVDVAEKRAHLAPGALRKRLDGLAASFRRRRRLLAGLAAALVLAAYAASGFYAVRPDEVGVLVQLGRLQNAAVEPGLHYRLPAPFTTLYRAQPDRARQLEFGFRIVGERGVADEPDAYLWESAHQTGIYEKRLDEAIRLTGDKNEVDLNLAVEYRLMRDALPHYFFHAADTEAVVRALCERCAQRAVGCMELPDVLTTGRIEIEQRIASMLQPLLDELELGVRVSAVRLQDVHPPTQVVPAFRAVATAREEQSTLIHRAEAYRNETLPKTRGQGVFLQRDAEAYVDEERLRAEGDAAYFALLAEVYRSHPEAARFLRYIDAVEAPLAGAKKVVLDDAIESAGMSPALSQYFMATEFLKWPSEERLALQEREPNASEPGDAERTQDR